MNELGWKYKESIPRRGNEDATMRWKRLNLKSAMVALAAFVSGLLFMYVMLLSRIQPSHRVLPLESALQELADSEGVDVQLLEKQLLENYRKQDASMCNGTSTNNMTCQQSTTGSADRMLSWDAIQAFRRLAIKRTCNDAHSQLPGSPRALWNLLQDNNNIYIDNKHQILFCTIPKAACSSWKSALAMLSDKLPDGSPNTLKNVHSNSFMSRLGLIAPPEITESHLYKATREYTKLMVVRHPFERLVSAYRDKFNTYNKWTKHFQNKYGRKIVLLYRGRNVTVESLKKGHDVTFEEFLTFISDESVSLDERLNPHWASYQQLCRPCQITYDHVIKFETLYEDNAVVLKRDFSVINATNFFPKRNVKEIPSKDIMVQYYSEIPGTLINKIYNMFIEDMNMFNYDLPPDILTNAHLR